MEIADLRARLGAAPPAMDVPPEAIAAPAGDDLLGQRLENLVHAAVLVPILPAPAAGVLLTKRTAHLSSHAGQVSFPGGRIDPEDASAEDAALREAEEEIGLGRRDVELLGRLPDYVTGTGFLITPVLGLIEREPELTISPHEVEQVFQLPLAVLLDPAAPQLRRAELRGRWRQFWVWPHPDHYIWGATAGILVHLARRLRGEA